MAENIEVFSFALTQEDHASIESLDSVDGRLGPDPTNFGRQRFLRRLINRFLPMRLR
jgi:2,5-diketo-D-gluconate reductase A